MEGGGQIYHHFLLMSIGAEQVKKSTELFLNFLLCMVKNNLTKHI